MGNKLQVMISTYRGYSNGESHKAHELFDKFIEEGFSYGGISDRPDYLVYASAEYLIVLLPQIIDEMLARGDTGNYLVYQIVNAIDPESSKLELYKQRSREVIQMADRSFSEKVCRFLDALTLEKPIPEDQLKRLIKFWQEKLVG